MLYDRSQFIAPALIDLTVMPEALSSGSPDASTLFFASYFAEGGFGRVDVDTKFALEAAQQGAETGDLLCKTRYAILTLGTFSSQARISKEAVRMLAETVPGLKDFALGDNAYAQAMLAVAIGRDPRASSKKEFFELSLRAAEQGEPFALLNVGYAYNNGIGVTRNYEEAILWGRRAAASGLAQAQDQLADFLMMAKVPQVEEALVNLQRAAEQGLHKAQLNMGTIAAKSGNMAKAIEWWQKAAIDGLADARLKLAQCYETGNDAVKRDRATAYGLYADLIAEDRNTSPRQCLLSDAETAAVGRKMRVLKMSARTVVDEETKQKYLVWPESEVGYSADAIVAAKLRLAVSGVRRALKLRS